MKNKKFILSSIVALTFLIACGDSAQNTGKKNAAGNNGANIFTAKCAMCHTLNEDKIGPALAGVQQRWGGDIGKIKAFIRNSNNVISSGDPYAVALYEKWNKSPMPSFDYLSEKDLDALVEYLK